MKKVLFLFMACLFVTIHAQAQVSVTGVALDESTLSLVVGEDSSLVAIITPADADDKNVVFTSSDSAVVDIITVQDTICQIKALSAGTATITVTTDDGLYTAICNITVTEPTPTTILVTGVSINENTLSLIVGEDSSLIATITPADADNKNVVFTSSDSAVVDIINVLDTVCYIKAISAGTATITVTTDDGLRTATCNITITEPAPTTIAVTGVQLNSNSIDIFEGKTQQLVATVLPDTATNKNITWLSEDPTIATVSSSGLVTAVKAGTTNIIVTTVDGGKADTCAVTVDIDTSNEIVEGGNARVYIANNRMYIQSAEAETIHIYGINGSLVYTNNKPEGEASFDINTQESILIVKGSSGWVRKIAK